MDEVFSTHAAEHWAKGLSVIPLLPREKKPFLQAWQQWHDHLPDAARQEEWIRNYPTHNMGLVLGRQSNVTVIDIDTTDEKIINAIMSVLPPSPWKRIGAKGFVLAYQYSGLNTFRVDDANGVRLVEYLSTRTQVVLPPSIHPTTQLPYEANVPLVDVYDKLHKLPDDIADRLHAALSLVTNMGNKRSNKFKLSDRIPVGGRDTQMNRNAGYQAGLVLRGEISLRKAISDLRAWVDMNVERKSGDEIDVEKGCRQIIQYIITDVNSKGKILPSGWDADMTDEEKKHWGLIFNDDQEEWKVEQLLEYIHKAFTDNGPEDPKRHDAVKFILLKISKSVHLTVMDTERVLQALKAGTKLSIHTFKKEIAELKKGPIDGMNHTEIAVEALKELEKKGYKIHRYNEAFYTWQGTHWEPIKDSEIWKTIATEFGDLPGARKASDHQGIMKVMATLVPQKIRVLEVDGVNFRNGFLTEDLKLVPHNADLGMTYLLPYNYEPELAGKAHKFEALLHTCWGHYPDFEEKKLALQEAMAVTLMGKGPTYQRAILLYGVAQCGKSQILEVVQQMVPEAARCAVPPDQWGETFTLSFLDQKLLNVVGELHEKKPMPGKQFKELIDGSQMSGQMKFKPLFNFIPKACHWFASNHLPRTKDTSNGFNRRWLILSFDRPVPANEMIPDLGKIIVDEEIDAVVAWALQAYPALRKRGSYTLPQSHNYYVGELAEQNSIVREWLNKKVVKKEDSKSKTHDLFLDFFLFSATHTSGNHIKEKEFSIQLDQILSEERTQGHIFDGNEKIYTQIALREKKQ